MSKVSSRNDWESYWGSKNRAEEVYSNKDRIARNLEAVELPSDASVLEIGAGTGRDSLPLAEMGANVYQLDYSFESLRLIKQTSNYQNVSPVGGDTFCLPFRDQTFDVVFHQGLLEHFPKDQADFMIEEQIRVLKVGGYLLIDVPQRYHPYTIIKHVLIAMGKWFAGWERSFSYHELNSVFKAHGLYPVHRYGEWMVPSLWYRILREVGKIVGARMPLYPPGIPLIKDIRKYMRTKLLRTTLPLYTGISIGIVAQKRNNENSRI